MAKRYVYSYNCKGFRKVDEIEIEFEWHPGFSISQKQKSIESLHNNYLKMYPNKKVLEISSKSQKEIGIRLSAFNLNYYSSYFNKNISVETAFQSAKVFDGDEVANSEIINMTSREAKSYIKTKDNKKLKKFLFEDIKFELEPKTLFYDWLYINALLQNKDLIDELLEYTTFTDIEFNPEKSINCQAKSVALFVGLIKDNILDYRNINQITKEEVKKILGVEEHYENINFFNDIK